MAENFLSEQAISLSNMGVKGNNGKAAKSKTLQHFTVLLVVAMVLVASVKVFGTAEWHSKAVPHEGQDIMEEKRAAVQNQIDNTEMNEASKLFEGMLESDVSEEGLVDAWGGDNKESNYVQFEFSNLDGEGDSSGIVIIELHPEWAPLGVQRIKELTASSFWEGCKFFRVVPNFMVQIGISGDPTVSKEWRSRYIKDDPVVETNARGMVSFAMAGKGTRTSQIFINTGKQNAYLDKEGFAPFGKVIDGMEIVDKIYDGYREKPNQGIIQRDGNAYLDKEFPKLSFISRAMFIEM